MKTPGNESGPRQPERKTDLTLLLRDEKRIGEALRRAVREALLVHKKLGHSIVVWKDDRVVILPPERIAVDEMG